MAVSGIECKEGCAESYRQEFIDKHLRYVFFKIVEDEDTMRRYVDIDSFGTEEETFDDFMAKLRELEAQGEPRYCVLRFEYKIPDVRDVLNNVCIVWIPENAKAIQKLAYSTSTSVLVKALRPHVNITLEVTRLEQVTRSEIIKAFEAS